MLFKKPHALPAVALLCIAVVLNACGFTPLYGQATPQSNGAINAELASIDVAIIPNRAGQILRGALQKSLAPKGRSPAIPAAYKLTVSLSENINTLAIAKNAFATRANLYLNASYTLIRLDDRDVVTRGSTQAISSYNILSSDYATLTAQANARERAIFNVSQDIQTRLAVFLRSVNETVTAPKS